MADRNGALLEITVIDEKDEVQTKDYRVTVIYNIHFLIHSVFLNNHCVTDTI